MKFVSNAGADRMLNLVRPEIKQGRELDMVSPSFSLFAFGELLAALRQLAGVRLVLPQDHWQNASVLPAISKELK